MIVANLNDLNTQDFMSIGALSDVRAKNQSYLETMPSTLIEELNEHLYFKNEYSMNRFTQYDNDPYAYELLMKTTMDEFIRGIEVLHFVPMNASHYNL